MPKVRRYSGDLKIELSFNDRTDEYRARICPVRGGGACETVHVGAPKYLKHAVDSPQAYDSAAHAAISFARDELQERADPNRQGSGWDIRRPRRARR